MKSSGISAILLLSLCIASPAAGAAPPEPARVSSSDPVVPADTTQVKKEHVRKETPPAGAEKQPETQAVSSEDEGDFWGECLGSIIGSFFGAVCSGIFGGDDEEVGTAEELTGEIQMPADMVAPAGALVPLEGFPYVAVIEKRVVGENTLWLWDRPGGYSVNGTTMESIPRGTEVRVMDYEVSGEMTWLLVSRLEPDAPQGWVPQTEVIVPEPVAEAAAGGEQPVPAATPAPEPFAEPDALSSADPPRWEIGAGVSIPVFSQTAVREEYNEGAFQIGAEAAAFLPHRMKLGLSVGYLHANGKPLYDYAAGDIKDSPQESDLDIFSIGLPFGQSIPIAGGAGFFSYGLGPALFMVQESALIYVYENDDLTGGRTDELTKWKGGLEALVTVGGVLGDRWPLSFQTRFAFIPWEADEEKSLTLDYLGTENIAFFSFGVGIGFSMF